MNEELEGVVVDLSAESESLREGSSRQVGRWFDNGSGSSC